MSGTPKNIYFIKAVVLLRKCGMNYYQICQAFDRKDKRNLIYYYKKYQNQWDLPTTKVVNEK